MLPPNEKLAICFAYVAYRLHELTILIRGRRPGETPVPAQPIQPYADFSSHNA
jgi:hypothetical protein